MPDLRLGDCEARFVHTNTLSVSRHLWLERWGDYIEMKPGSTYEVTIQGQAPDRMEVVEKEGGFLVWAWVDTISEVCEDGIVIRPFTNNRVPGIPPGMTMQGFIGTVFETDVSGDPP